MIPDWLQPTLALFPLAAWMFLGVGVPWALALLPRRLWRERVTVLAVGMALGPLAVTAWQFVLGTWGRLSWQGTLVGSVALAALGAALAMLSARQGVGTLPPYPRQGAQPPGPHRDDAPRRRGKEAGRGRSPSSGRKARAARLAGGAGAGPSLLGARGQSPRSLGERALIASVALLVALNVVVSAYWPFIAYDAQWVYGYNARIFALQARIPETIGYYPPLVSLSYTLMQQAWAALGGALLNDHAARVVIPWFNLAAILMAWELGWRAWRSRRAALLTAAIWALYPHVAAWAGAGDLEIVLTLYMSGAAAFFIEAWRNEDARSATLSGVLLGGALWTKPTGGALALGVMLAVALALLRARDLRAWWPRLRVALIAGAASAPLGALWYVRNLALGHAPIVFPASYWHSLAQRSGQELGWPLLIAALIVGALLVRGEQRRGPTLALALMLAGALPSALGRVNSADALWRWVRGDVGASGRMGPLEWALVLAGAALLAWHARPAWRRLSPERRQTVALLLTLALPYSLVWFWDFSYHYRLSFAVVPIFATLAAALLDGALWDTLSASRTGRALGALTLAGTLTLAGAAGVQHSAQVWLAGGLPDDTAKYDHGNPALMQVVHMLERYAEENGAPPVVVIPGEDRLPFYFPTWEIRAPRDFAALPTRLEDLAGADIFIGGSVYEFLLQQAGKWPNSLLADAAVGSAYHVHNVQSMGRSWPTVLEPIPLQPDGSLPADDGNFRYEAYTVHPQARYTPMYPNDPLEKPALFGDLAYFLGHDVITLDWTRGRRIILTLYWRPTAAAPAPRSYSVYIHLLDAEGNMIAQWDGVPLLGQYPTIYWRAGESLLDYWDFHVPEDVPLGPAQLRIGLYDPLSGERLPVTVDGQPLGDGLTINTRIVVK